MLPGFPEWLILGAIVVMLAISSLRKSSTVTESKVGWLVAIVLASAGVWDTGRSFYSDGDLSSGVMLFIFALCLCISASGLIRRLPATPA